jgi:hypothetical protein
MKRRGISTQVKRWMLEATKVVVCPGVRDGEVVHSVQVQCDSVHSEEASSLREAHCGGPLSPPEDCAVRFHVPHSAECDRHLSCRREE